MATDSEEIRQQIRSREGHSDASLKARIRNYRRAIRHDRMPGPSYRRYRVSPEAGGR
jgi:hypothetical protein